MIDRLHSNPRKLLKSTEFNQTKNPNYEFNSTRITSADNTRLVSASNTLQLYSKTARRKSEREKIIEKKYN